MTMLRRGCLGLLLFALALPAVAQRAPWGEAGGLRTQQGAGRDQGSYKKGREATPPPRRDDGGGGQRLSPEQREQLRRDLDRANREIYHRKRRD
jgi:hypothetical protein